MRAWKGMGNSDRILACLFAHDAPMTTQEITKATGLTYLHAYADLRRLAGPGFRYTGVETEHNADGYPVIWHMWESRVSRTLWSLVPDYRSDQAAAAADLEAMFSDSRGGAS